MISQLKGAIFEEKQIERDFIALKKQRQSIVDKYEKLLQEKQMQDNDNNHRIDSNAFQITQMRREIEDLSA